MTQPIRVTVWNEFRHEIKNEKVKSIYPNGMHNVIGDALKARGMDVKTATLDEPEHGLTDAVLEATDVLIWWGHGAHKEVQDEIVNRVHKRVMGGMGFVALHSAHFSKPFVKLMGTTCNLKWREAGEKERLWVVNPGHPIVQGVGPYFEIEHEEMYGEMFDIPQPDELILISWFAGGEVFRSGATFTRGKGRIFYFRPGHETYPTYHNETVQLIIGNGVEYVAPRHPIEPVKFGNSAPLESITAEAETAGIH